MNVTRQYNTIGGQGNRFMDLRSRRPAPFPEPAIPEDFGIKTISGTVVTMYGGEITIGYTGHTVADTNLTVDTDTAFLGWDYNIDTTALTIVNFGSTFLRDPAHIRKWIWKVEKYALAGVTPAVYWVRVIRGGHLNPILPANMG
jgi:hypothetical protein